MPLLSDTRLASQFRLVMPCGQLTGVYVCFWKGSHPSAVQPHDAIRWGFTIVAFHLRPVGPHRTARESVARDTSHPSLHSYLCLSLNETFDVFNDLLVSLTLLDGSFLGLPGFCLFCKPANNLPLAIHRRKLEADTPNALQVFFIFLHFL